MIFVSDEINQHLVDSLFPLLQEQYEEKYSGGRCMWDRTANLVLQRTIEETGQTMEFIIPQDSIRRQADGSWLATYSDIADQGCSHYTYAVRIDQSRSDLHVQDSASLKPIQIMGPSLYFDEAATITRFEASQGDATTQMKPGVLLRWETNSNAVDEFVLLRKATGSDATPDTVYRGTNYDYFDRSAVPDQHYEYTIAANYTCNGRTTTNSASATGWRTPYGEISGTVSQSDNSGMAGVAVALQDGEGNIVRTMQTDASGAYKFDSLNYGVITQCDEPTVKIMYYRNLYGNEVKEQNMYVRILNPDGVVIQDWHNNVSEGTIYTCPIGSFVELKYVDSSWKNSGEIISFEVTNNLQLDCLPYFTQYWDAATGSFRFGHVFHVNLDSAAKDRCHDILVNGTDYAVVPTHQYGVFSFNNTSAGTASITLSQDNAVATGLDFVNTASVRLTGRVLYKNTTIPVAGAMFLLNGDTVRRGDSPLTSGIDGNFELLVTKGQPCRLQVFKDGHSFEGDGILRVEGGSEVFVLDKALDGVRFYDETKVRLVGRVAGGNDQRDLPHGFGVGKNNLGDNLQLVLQLEGDNTAHFVHDPNDLSRDTIRQTTPHIIYSTDTLAAEKERTMGSTQVILEKKRIIVQPDVTTGEFAVDLFPVKYKVVQATANGYATLFTNGQGSETFDLTNAPLQKYVSVYDATENKLTEIYTQGDSKGRASVYDLPRSTPLYNGDSIAFNAVYDRIYHAPVEVSLKQVLYGMEKNGYGEEEMEVSGMDIRNKEKVRLYETQADG
ncbi:MAG: carboxypeptidase regulatory-like domain-containing protein, partial [Paludibacteraceae bacterium]|nr:carboxypeptidase regulatory-like domain-containing protein [Paludibacteraceae bacterium]